MHLLFTSHFRFKAKVSSVERIERHLVQCKIFSELLVAFAMVSPATAFLVKAFKLFASIFLYDSFENRFISTLFELVNLQSDKAPTQDSRYSHYPCICDIAGMLCKTYQLHQSYFHFRQELISHRCGSTSTRIYKFSRNSDR